MTRPEHPPDLPELGTRISLRYLRAPGAQPAGPSTADVVGRLLEAGPRVRVRSADGVLHELRLADVLYVRRLTDRPVKNSAIRAVEHAAALAWPGTEHQWLDGWLLRAGHGVTMRANSAVPLDMFAHESTIPAIIDWYAQRGLAARLAVPERLLRLPDDIATQCQTRTLIGELAGGEPDSTGSGVALSPRPDADWLARHPGDAPADVLSAVVDGAVVFASIPGVAVGRAAVTAAPDGTRWLGLSQVHVIEDRRGRGHGRAVCAALRSWGRDRGATHAYAQLRDGDRAALGLFEAVGLHPQHRTRYLDAALLSP